MKNLLKRLLPGVLALCLCLSACGGGSSAKSYDPAATAKALLESTAFSDTLDTLDKDTAAVMYGIDPATITDCAVYASLSMGAEEIAVLTLSDAAPWRAICPERWTSSTTPSWSRPATPPCWWWPPTPTPPRACWTA